MAFNIRCQGGPGAYIYGGEGVIRISARLIDEIIGLERLHVRGWNGRSRITSLA